MSEQPSAPKDSGLPEADEPSGAARNDHAPEATEECMEFGHLLHEVTRGQVRALILDHVADKIVADFAAHGDERPKMLLRLPGRGSFPADVDHVLELSADLLLLAARERARVRQLLQCRATVPTEDRRQRPLPSVLLPSDPSEQVIDTSISRPKGKRPPDGDWTLGTDTPVVAQRQSRSPGAAIEGTTVTPKKGQESDTH